MRVCRTCPPLLPWGSGRGSTETTIVCNGTDTLTHMLLLLFTLRQMHRTELVHSQRSAARPSLSHLPVAPAPSRAATSAESSSLTLVCTHSQTRNRREGRHLLTLPASVVVLLTVVVAVENVPEQEDTPGRRGRGRSASLFHLLL